MPATSVSHKFFEGKPRLVGKVGGGGVASAVATTIPHNFVGLTNGNAYVVVVNRTDATGSTKNPASQTETFIGEVSGGNFINCTRQVEGTGQAWAADTVLEILITATGWNKMVEGIETEHNKDGTHKKVTGLDNNTAITQKDSGGTARDVAKIDSSNVATFGNTTTTTKIKAGSSATNGHTVPNVADSIVALVSQLNLSQGNLQNGKIVTSVSSNNLTVALKTFAGSDPSSTDPVYVRIGNSWQPITSALSVTLNAGTNWCNAGSAELATNEIDYFVYLGYNATDGVVLGFSRIPCAIKYGDFSTTSTNDRYAKISTITNAASTDEYEVVGRFNATLSAGASYNWSIPATSVVISRPIYETRLLTMTPTVTGCSVRPDIQCRYKVVGNMIKMNYYWGGGATGTSNTTGLTYSLAFTVVTLSGYVATTVGRVVNNSAEAAPGTATLASGGTTLTCYNGALGAGWTAAGYKFWEGQIDHALAI